MQPSVQQYYPITRGKVYAVFILSVIVMAFSIAMLVLLASNGFIGFNNSNPFVVGTCTDSYYKAKYQSNTIYFVENVFLWSIMSVLFSALIFIFLLAWTIKICSSESSQHMPYQSSKFNLYFLYIVSSLCLLSCIVIFGYNLTYKHEMLAKDTCSITYDRTYVSLLLAVATVMFVFGIICWMYFLYFNCVYCDVEAISREEKYREVLNTNQTEPNEQRNQRQKARRVDDRYDSNKYGSIIRRNNDPQPNVFEQTKQDLHSNQMSYIPKKQQREPQLVYSRNRPANNYTNTIRKEDDDSFNKQQNKYLKEQNQHITPMNGLYRKKEEDGYLRDSNMRSRVNQSSVRRNQKRIPSSTNSYFKGGDRQRERERERERERDYRDQVSSRSPVKSPVKGRDREGMLINYIRGKYAN